MTYYYHLAAARFSGKPASAASSETIKQVNMVNAALVAWLCRGPAFHTAYSRRAELSPSLSL